MDTFWIIILASGIWVLVDAKTIGVKKGQIQGLGDLGPWGWFFACLLLWIISFPFYLAKRPEYKRIHNEFQQQDKHLTTTATHGSHFTNPHQGCISNTLKFIGLVIVGFIVLMGIVGYLNVQNANNTAYISDQKPKEVAQNPAGSTANISAVAPSAHSRWKFSSSEDKMRRSITSYATLLSTNQLQFEFPYSGGATGSIILRKSAKHGHDVMLQVSKGQFACALNCSINVKFDNGKIERYSVVEPSGGSTGIVFITAYDRFTKKLKNSKHLVIEAEFFQDGIHQIEFDTAGLEATF